MFCKKKKKEPRSAAEQLTETAAARTSAAMDQAVEYLTPYVTTAGDYLQTASERVGPAAKQARENAAKFAQEQVQPAFIEALNRVTPAVERARGRVEHDLVPRLVDLLEAAEAHPAVAEASRRGQATLAAAKGDVEAPHTVRLAEVVHSGKSSAPARRGAGRRVVKVVAVTAVVAGAAVAVRQFLAARDDAWTAQSDVDQGRPQGPTLLNEDGSAAGSSAASRTSAAKAAGSRPTGSTPTVEPDVTTEGDPAQEMVEEGSPVKARTSTRASSTATKSTKSSTSKSSASRGTAKAKSSTKSAKTATSRAKEAPHYGDGSYIGTEPPEGYTIKGNERSMKYHVPSARGYDRTIADVWFSSDEAAERAGFTRAQR